MAKKSDVKRFIVAAKDFKIIYDPPNVKPLLSIEELKSFRGKSKKPKKIRR